MDSKEKKLREIKQNIIDKVEFLDNVAKENGVTEKQVLIKLLKLDPTDSKINKQLISVIKNKAKKKSIAYTIEDEKIREMKKLIIDNEFTIGFFEEYYKTSSVLLKRRMFELEEESEEVNENLENQLRAGRSKERTKLIKFMNGFTQEGLRRLKNDLIDRKFPISTLSGVLGIKVEILRYILMTLDEENSEENKKFEEAMELNKRRKNTNYVSIPSEIEIRIVKDYIKANPESGENFMYINYDYSYEKLQENIQEFLQFEFNTKKR
ncbi:MAG: hypothetical protein R3Y13_00900 [bacterium]